MTRRRVRRVGVICAVTGALCLFAGVLEVLAGQTLGLVVLAMGSSMAGVGWVCVLSTRRIRKKRSHFAGKLTDASNGAKPSRGAEPSTRNEIWPTLYLINACTFAALGLIRLTEPNSRPSWLLCLSLFVAAGAVGAFRYRNARVSRRKESV